MEPDGSWQRADSVFIDRHAIQLFSQCLIANGMTVDMAQSRLCALLGAKPLLNGALTIKLMEKFRHCCSAAKPLGATFQV
jgi:hypothetical protein